MSLRRTLLSAAIVAAMTAAACGEPPDREIQQAQGAIDAAKAAGADQYAHEELAAAEKALKDASAAVNDRDYRLALNNALDAREHAQTAAKQAADGKAAARSDADRVLRDAQSALAEARARLKTAETVRVPTRTLNDARRLIADGDSTVQKARAAFDQADYTAVGDILAGTTTRLLATARDLETAAASGARRRR
jgi:flagellar hook-basal body complex protein FliE